MPITRFQSQFLQCAVCGCGGLEDTRAASMLITPSDCPTHAICPSCAKQWHEQCIVNMHAPSCVLCRRRVNKWVKTKVHQRKRYLSKKQKRQHALFVLKLREIISKRIIENASQGWTRSMVLSAVNCAMVAHGFQDQSASPLE